MLWKMPEAAGLESGQKYSPILCWWLRGESLPAPVNKLYIIPIKNCTIQDAGFVQTNLEYGPSGSVAVGI